MVTAISLAKLEKFLEQELKISQIKDMSLNGMQVMPDDKSSKDIKIKKIGFAVDACVTAFEMAKKNKCDLLIVHHGLYWGRDKPITGSHYKRIKFLLDNKIGLYAAHLPIDLHPKFGHNILLAKMLNLKNIKKFGEYNGSMVGFSGKFTAPKDIRKIVTVLNKKIGSTCTYVAHGPAKIKSVAILAGRGASALDEAIKNDFDLFITGEAIYENYHETLDSGINLICGGHYYTEKPGMEKLADIIAKKFKIKTVFLDVPADI